MLRRYLLCVGEEPVQLADSYFLLEAAEGTTIEGSEKLQGRAHALLEQDLGRELERYVDELTFRMPTPEEARALRIGAGVPVVRLLRTLYDTGGRALEVSDCVLAGDRHVLVYEVPAS